VEESTSYNFTMETKAWLQPMSESKTGFESTNPSYEEYYQKGISVGTSAPTKAGWVYPALFNYRDKWILISETSLDRNYCGTRLQQNSPDGEFSVGFPDPREVFPGGNAFPESALPWYMPWRIIAIGSLKTITESTLGTDLAKSAVKVDNSVIKPGISSWSWVLLKDDSTVFDVQKKFVDYAADMKWEYCLVDADWDKKIGYGKMQELVDYAKQKNVGIILWYNSAGSWNTVKFTPKDKLVTRESRAQEFTLLQKMGVKGLKIDFFGGDGQSMINYYIDIMEDAARYGLLLNFHGATLPRGWHRTYPNLMTMESIKGMEFITFDQRNANEEPMHATTIPFTRNVFDPMDFTPMALYKIPGIERKTTTAFELATSVIFLSGIQHMAETPAGMRHMPVFVKDFLRNLPVNWDDVNFIDGYPGKFVVMARKSGDRWIVAGINGETDVKALSLDLSFIKSAKGQLITDDGNGSLTQTEIHPTNATKVNIQANGGFVIVF
jgi:alpha-glucosidase